MTDLQIGATNLLATSVYYKGNILLPGKPPRSATPAARAATEGEAPPTADTPSLDAQIENIVCHLRTGTPLNQAQTAYICHTFKCIHCLSNTHEFDTFKSITKQWAVTVQPPDAGKSRSNGCAPGNNSCRTAAPVTLAVPVSSLAAPPQPDPKTQVAQAAHTLSNPTTGDDPKSEADKSDEAFTFYGYKSDPELLSALSTQAARKTANQVCTRFYDAPPATTTIALVAACEVKWVDSCHTINLVDGPGASKP
jgi:hypothetical protein